MILILELILLFLVWHTVGALVLSFIPMDVISKADGVEFVNPAYIYKHARVNWFGAFVVAFFYALCCPFGAIGYWFYKLCVIGRKELED